MTTTQEVPNRMHSILENATSIIDQVATTPKISVYLRQCSGILIMSSTEYAMALSGRHGTGDMLKHFKNANKWSYPSATRIRGLGVGLQMGMSDKNLIMFLSEHELRTLTDTAILQFGIQGNFDIAHIETDTYFIVSDVFRMDGKCRDFNTVRGSKAGISLQGAAISPMWKVNHEFYGDSWYPNVVKTVPKQIMEGYTKKELSFEDKLYIGALHAILNEASTALELTDSKNWTKSCDWELGSPRSTLQVAVPAH